MADKKRDILEFVEQSNFEQFTPTPFNYIQLLKLKLEKITLFSAIMKFKNYQNSLEQFYNNFGGNHYLIDDF